MNPCRQQSSHCGLLVALLALLGGVLGSALPLSSASRRVAAAARPSAVAAPDPGGSASQEVLEPTPFDATDQRRFVDGALFWPLWPAEALLTPQQVTRWQGIDLEGASCGRGAPYRYYLSLPPGEPEGILFLLNGGGACVKEGPAPQGVTGIAQQLYCMDYSQWVDPLANDLLIALIAARVQLVRRDDPTNPFHSYAYVFVPYCTGDVHAGAMAEPYDYDPRPDHEFLVLHRGHLNVVAVLDDVAARLAGVETAVVTGVSAGGFGAILNFPEFARRWPRVVLIPDSGIAPPHPASLMFRLGPGLGERWGARSILPGYCSQDRCLANTLELLFAHARYYDGGEAPWLPFGFLQSQQDSVLTKYLEIEPCSYEMGLRWGMAEQPDNVRAYVPASDEHVFLATPGYATPHGRVDLFHWFSAVATARTAADLPPDAIDPWAGCHALRLPWLGR